jgi:3-oxoacyl-[acyl-carrier protein] reductase
MKTSRHVMITGSNGGIGKSLIKKFLYEGYAVVATIRKDNSDFSDWCLSLIEETGARLSCELLNLDDAALAQNQMREILKKYPELSHLINNAAMAFGATILMTSIKSFRQVFEVNMISQFAISQIFAKHILRARSGSITSISSISTKFPLPGTFAYGSSKLALEYMTRVLEKELASTEIKVGAVMLGLVDTRMLSQMDSISINTMTSLSDIKSVLSATQAAEIVFSHAFEKECMCSDVIHCVSEVDVANSDN